MKSKKFSEKVTFFSIAMIAIITFGLFFAQVIIPKITYLSPNRGISPEKVSTEDTSSTREWKLIENYLMEQSQNDTIVSLKKFNISKNGSLMKDLPITRDEAFQIAKSESLEIGIDSPKHEQYPIVYPGDVFVRYELSSGAIGWYKDRPEYICLTFEEDLDK